MPRVRIALVSDIHAAIPKQDGNDPSYALTAPNMDVVERDAILSLQKLIEKEQLRASYMICCGDMADRANPTAMNYAWRKFNELAKSLDARPIATVGNHDIDSRFAESDHDARGLLRNLEPTYPLGLDTLNHEFWSRNFVIIVADDIRFVILNSCAYHGVNPNDKAPEYLHGRVSNYTLGDLKSTLESADRRDLINILLCHHHPHKHQDIESDDYSSMLGGEKLIDLLRELHIGPWMIMHGHKHHPRLLYGAGGPLAPLILGAGSLAAKIHADLQSKSRNQFYILEFDMDAAGELELQLAGEVHAWDFQLGKGWVKAKKGSGLPSRSGFGYAVAQVKKEAREIHKTVTDRGGMCEWTDLLIAHPHLRFVLPAEIESIERELKSAHSIGIIYDEYGTPIQFASAK